MIVHASHHRPTNSEIAELSQRVQQRLSQGLAPPREAYLVQNRSLIDWTDVPEWARPIDPEIFEGCSHEG
jgi:hypothetical protein